MRSRGILAGLLVALLVGLALPGPAQAADEDRSETELEATPLVGHADAGRLSLYAPAFQAQLTTADGDPIEGQPLDFMIDDQHGCTAMTDEDGYGYCFAPAATPLAVATGGYDAVYRGSTLYEPASDRAGLAYAFGEDVGR